MPSIEIKNDIGFCVVYEFKHSLLTAPWNMPLLWSKERREVR